MAKVIALSGPQGGGKTTLLNGLVEKNPRIVVDNFKVARRVQRVLGWVSLDNVFEDADTLMEFQNMIMKVKYLRDRENADRTDVDIVLVERSMADVATYTQLWAYELIARRKWALKDGVEYALQFGDDASQLQEVYSGNIYLPYMPHVKFEEDPHRAKANFIDSFDEVINIFYETKNPKDVPVFRIGETSVDGRINEAYDWITSLER